jgi:hypothetical protein
MIAFSTTAGGDPDPYRGLREVNPEAKIAAGFESAYLGFTVSSRPVAAYEYEECVRIIAAAGGGLSESEATTYFYYNTLSECTDEDSPVFIRTEQWPS